MGDLKLFIGGLGNCSKMTELKGLFITDVRLIVARDIEHANELDDGGEPGMLAISDLMLDEEGCLHFHDTPDYWYE